jgi:L-asparagine oxygenase
MLPIALQGRTVQRLRLPERARREWLAEAAGLTYPDPRDAAAWRGFVDASAGIARRHLTDAMAEALLGFSSVDGADALVLENLPVDAELPPAPSDGKRPASKGAVSEAVIAGLVEPHATIIAYANEKSGAPIHEITPVAGQEHIQSSAGRAPFACHTDVAFLAPLYSPSGLILFGLRNEPGAPTAMLPLDRLMEAAPEALVRSLEKAIFRHPAPASFEMNTFSAGPILRRDERGGARIAVQTHAVQPLNEEARVAIVGLRELLDGVESERVVLAPGVALLFKNDRVLHGRDAFNGERWLQRAYFTDAIERFRERAGGDGVVFDARALIQG